MTLSLTTSWPTPTTRLQQFLTRQVFHCCNFSFHLVSKTFFWATSNFFFLTKISGHEPALHRHRGPPPPPFLSPRNNFLLCNSSNFTHGRGIEAWPRDLLPFRIDKLVFFFLPLPFPEPEPIRFDFRTRVQVVVVVVVVVAAAVEGKLLTSSPTTRTNFRKKKNFRLVPNAFFSSWRCRVAVQ